VACIPLLEARRVLEPNREQVEKKLRKLAVKLPIAGVVDEIKGLSLYALAKIVGEAGDLSCYRTLRGLFKRMGVGLHGEKRQQRVSDAKEALAMGYNPRRRSTMWNIGNDLIGGLGRGPKRLMPGQPLEQRPELSEWQVLYLKWLRRYAEIDPEKFSRGVSAEGRESFSKWAHNKAKRKVEKALLRRLYQEWRRLRTS
jgi:hypothetical protein